MRLHRPLLAAAAAAVLLPAASPALGADAVAAAGRATSSATLVRITVAGHTVAIGTVVAEAQTLTSASPTVRFVPIDLDGTKTGEIVVDPSNSPKTVAPVTSSGVPAAVLSATSPSATLTASKATAGPVSELTADFGSASVLGIPLTIDGAVQFSAITTEDQSLSAKAVELGGFGLPSVADLLAALGIDLSALPVDVVYALLTDLPLTISGAIADAAAAAHAAVGTAQSAYDAKQAAIETATATVATATDVHEAAAESFAAELTEAGLTEDGWALLTELDKLNPLYADVVAAEATLAQEAADLADAQQALADLQAELAPLLATLEDAIADLVTIVRNALDATPIAAIGDGEIGTQAYVGAGKRADVTGELSGLTVLGQDVFAAVLGNSTIDIADLAGTAADSVNTALATATSALSGVLQQATGLVFPAPQVELLAKQTGTGTDGAFGTANASVTALKVTVPGITIPSAFALPNAANLPGVSAITGGFATAPMTFELGVLGDAARFRPATAGNTPATPPKRPARPVGEDLPATGGPLGLAVLAVLATVGGLTVRRSIRG